MVKIKKVKKLSKEDYFDDCFICQSLKVADGTGKTVSVEDMVKIFAEGNKRQAKKKES